MNKLADALTSSRFVMVIFILLTVVRGGEDSLPTIVLLTVACWISDVLDGKLARNADEPTRLGRYDVVADLALAIVLAIYLVLLDVINISLMLSVMVLVTISTHVFHFLAPRLFAMGLTYGLFTYSVWQRDPPWGLVILASLVLLAVLNPERTKQQVGGFIRDVVMFVRKR